LQVEPQRSAAKRQNKNGDGNQKACHHAPTIMTALSQPRREIAFAS
jgi:hypothetical protein